MLKTEFYKQQSNMLLVKTYSTDNRYIKQVETGLEYSEAIDIGVYENGIYKPKNYTYVETDKEIVYEEHIKE